MTISATTVSDAWLLSELVVGELLTLVIVAVFLKFGSIWFQAYMSGADVSLMSLIGMSLRRIKPSLIEIRAALAEAFRAGQPYTNRALQMRRNLRRPLPVMLPASGQSASPKQPDPRGRSEEPGFKVKEHHE